MLRRSFLLYVFKKSLKVLFPNGFNILPLVHDNFYKQQKKFKFGQIIWWKNLYNVLKISNFEEIFQDSLWLLTSRHHRAKIANYSTSCTPISEKQSICRASGSWQR